MRSKPRLLFLCTGNSCRSQMAEGWARELLSDSVEPCSAGTDPGPIDPRAVAVMAEAGVDISGQRSKHVREVSATSPAWVVTVCDRARESCPAFPGARRQEHAGFDDPPRLAAGAASEEEALAHYRRVRDDIRSFVASLRERLSPLQ